MPLDKVWDRCVQHRDRIDENHKNNVADKTKNF